MRIHLALAAAVLGLAGLAGAPEAAVLRYETVLSGAAEDPPVTSTGTGRALVTVDTVAREFAIDAEFSELVGTTTIAHIHGPTAVPGAGTAGVITPLPTFPGFPVGVTEGDYVMVFETDLATSYNPDFIAAAGGTVDAAEASLFAALAEGSAYLNIHTTFVGSGEIRGFFEPAAPIPLPAGAVLSLSALAALGAIGARRRRAA